MLDGDNKYILPPAEKPENDETDSALDTKIDESLLALPLDKQQEHVVQNIIKAPTQKELNEQFELFNMNQSKKNALRIIKLNSLLDKVEDQAIKRFEKRPDQISNKELLEYMQVVAGQIDRSQKFIDTLSTKPMITQTEAKNTEVNINIGTSLNRDSKEKVIDAIQALLRQINDQESMSSENAIDAEFSDTNNEATQDDNSECIINDDADLLNSEDNKGDD